MKDRDGHKKQRQEQRELRGRNKKNRDEGKPEARDGGEKTDTEKGSHRGDRPEVRIERGDHT